MKHPIISKTRLIAIILTLAFFLSPVTSYSAETQSTFHPAKVMDISDKAYEPVVIDLLDNAKKSIVLSMYILKPTDDGPVNLLVNDLVEALERGVSVTVYLNTKFKSKKTVEALGGKSFQLLKSKGAEIHHFRPRHRVHDKLIIVDTRYVVQAGANWRVSELGLNYEAAILIDSPELAREKLRRLEGEED